MKRPLRGDNDLSSSSEEGQKASQPRLRFDFEKLRDLDVACAF